MRSDFRTGYFNNSSAKVGSLVNQVMQMVFTAIRIIGNKLWTTWETCFRACHQFVYCFCCAVCSILSVCHNKTARFKLCEFARLLLVVRVHTPLFEGIIHKCTSCALKDIYSVSDIAALLGQKRERKRIISLTYGVMLTENKTIQLKHFD
jgi:hypothetical protein